MWIALVVRVLRDTLAVACVLLILPSNACAQSGKNVTHQSLVWFGYFNTLKFDERWSLVTDIQDRHFIDGFVRNQFDVRTQLARTLGSGWDVRAGGSFWLQGATNPAVEDVPTVPELRPHVEFDQKQPFHWGNINQRFRFEARYYHNVDNGQLSEGYTFLNYRLRYRFGFDLPLIRAANGIERLSFRISDEVMLNLGARIVLNTFDQNRFQADLAFGITKLLSVELGYVNWFQQRYTGTDYYNRDILRFAVVHKIDLSHKNAATMESK